MAKKRKGSQFLKLIDDLEHEAKAELVRLGYPTDRNELRSLLFEEARNLAQARSSELKSLDAKRMKAHHILILLGNFDLIREAHAGADRDVFGIGAFNLGRFAHFLYTDAVELRVAALRSKAGGSLTANLRSGRTKDDREAEYKKWIAEWDRIAAEPGRSSATQISRKVGAKFEVSPEWVRKKCKELRQKTENRN